MSKVLAPLCEQAARPLGVESAAPRLTWRAEGLTRQTAYQVQAASRLDLLETGHPDLWDSGRVSSGQSHLVSYGGPLLSRQRVFWRVRLWDQEGEASEFSESTWWEMGLLKANDWSAQWIGRPGVDLPNHDSPVLPSPLFRKSFEVPAGLVDARLRVRVGIF